MRLALKSFLIAPLALTLSGCIQRAELKTHFWLESGLPKAVCAKYPEVAKSGIYRKLNDGRYEFVSYCNPLIVHYLPILDADLEELLNKYVGPEK